MSKKIRISNKAYRCLMWFKNHPYYGESKSFSKAIEQLTKEWFYRDGKNMNESLKSIKGEK